MQLVGQKLLDSIGIVIQLIADEDCSQQGVLIVGDPKWVTLPESLRVRDDQLDSPWSWLLWGLRSS